VPEAKEETSLDRLWKEYGQTFRVFDDLTLARWCAQTLGQLHGRVWRMSHPIVGAYRLASGIANERAIWSQRLVHVPAGYTTTRCCGAPVLPLFTRDVGERGLACIHCGDTCASLEEFPAGVASAAEKWAGNYAKIHDVAHWSEEKQRRVRDYDAEFEAAARRAEDLLAAAAVEVVPRLVDRFPAIVWEDQDECLEVRPEDVEL
jgi:hypothetical protein